jgi:hypothetical protein
MGLGAYRGVTRQAAGRSARSGVALALGLLGALSLGACGSNANRPIPVASATDLAAPATAPTTQAAAPERGATPGETETVTATAALPGDTAEAEDAEQATEVTYETAAPADPDEVMGLRRDEVQQLLGKPGLVRREAPAEVWQYESRGCVLDVFLYEASADLEVVYIEARNGAAVTAATATCLGAVMDDRRQTPTS